MAEDWHAGFANSRGSERSYELPDSGDMSNAERDPHEAA